MAGPAKSGVEGDVAGSNEEHDCRTSEETYRQGCAVVEKLEAHHSVEKQDPGSGSYRGNMNSSKALVSSQKIYIIFINRLNRPCERYRPEEMRRL